MLNDRGEWLWHTNIGAFSSVWVSRKACSFQASCLVSDRLPTSCWRSFARPPSWMVLIYSPGKTPSHLWLTLRMASSFTNQASSFSEPVRVLAMGRFYGYNHHNMLNKIAFPGLRMVRPLLKVHSSSSGHHPQVSSHLLASLKELLSSRHWVSFLERV